MRLSLIIPTRNRHEELARTLGMIARYDPALLGESPELIVIDNESGRPVRTPPRLANGVRTRVIRLDRNAGAAARNTAASHAAGDWLLMLDDDSAPVAGDFARVLQAAPPDLVAIGGEIFLPGGAREAGGLPEVIIGCGCAVRRDAFLGLGGYDERFEYYAEEYDLCARLIARGLRITHTRAIRFEHRKVAHGRSFDRILARLVRNNGWTIARYAPDAEREPAMHAMLDRYRRIGALEDAIPGYEAGRTELFATLDRQPRSPLSQEHWDRFTGLAACREHLGDELTDADTVALVRRGKGDDLIERAVRESGTEIVPDPLEADRLVVGTLSPGPMLDAAEQTGAAAPWRVPGPELLLSNA